MAKNDGNDKDETKDSDKAAATGAAAGASAGGNGGDADKDKDKKTQTPKKVPALRIKAKVKSFRRAGLAFGEEPTTVAVNALRKDQVAALKAEPMLIVEDVEIEQ